MTSSHARGLRTGTQVHVHGLQTLPQTPRLSTARIRETRPLGTYHRESPVQEKPRLTPNLVQIILIPLDEPKSQQPFQRRARVRVNKNNPDPSNFNACTARAQPGHE